MNPMSLVSPEMDGGNNATLSRNPLWRPGTYDFRILALPELRNIYNMLSPNFRFAADGIGVVDDRTGYVNGGLLNPWTKMKLGGGGY